tara:strand:- start:10769 stop:11710 length:942 start_codon:yes stop_codon:yes gene_type:complete
MSSLPDTMAIPDAPAAPRTRFYRGAASYSGLAYLFSAPAFILLALTTVVPIILVLLASLTDYSLGSISFDYIGLDNYGRLLADRYFWNALRNSALYALLTVPLAVGLALVLATILNDRVRTRRFYEIVYFLPITSTLTAMSIVWSYLLNGHIGPLAQAMSWLGLPRLDFFSDGNLALVGLAMIGIWHQLGFNLVLFLAGFTVISKELNEASALDGVHSLWDRLRFIIWPLLAPTTLVVLVLNCIGAFQAFDTVAVLTNGGPYGSTDMLLYKINIDTFEGMKAGYGSAMTVVYLVIIVLFSILQVVYSNRKAAR